ncbi:Putative two-component response regulator [hydrothermal vent metagenome]|uniref:Putative two-component response regulator n=1 Tax=hydrothermal vent metagenome TaxID=652676 RepID=A0A1W1BYF6_9ZZZZ
MQRILIIEENKAVANLIAKKIASEFDFEVDIAYKLSEAKLFLSRYSYFIVLTELKLADSPHGEVVDFLLQKKQKVIILTNNIDKDFRKQMLQKNIIDYINKSGAQDINYVISMLKRLQANQKHTVLVADDSMPMRTRYKNMLENLFFRVVTVAHGEEALNYLQTNPNISLVVTDYNMPVVDGLELTKELRLEYDKNALPIIAISSSEDEEVLAKFLKSGANDYIKKPFSKEEFYCRINNTIEAYENVQAVLNSANRDFLTGLYNRRYLFANIEEYLKKAEEEYSKLYLAIVSIDNFKDIVEKYGYEEGDRAIITLSEILRTSTKPQDLVTRFAQEEFCLALFAQNDERALELFEHIRKNIEEFLFTTKDQERIPFIISIGLTYFEDGDDINEVINQADMNLYEAKKSGKNRIVFKKE